VSDGAGSHVRVVPVRRRSRSARSRLAARSVVDRDRLGRLVGTGARRRAPEVLVPARGAHRLHLLDPRRGARLPRRHVVAGIDPALPVARPAGGDAELRSVHVRAGRRVDAADRALRADQHRRGDRTGADHRSAAAVRVVRRIGAARESRGRRRALQDQRGERRERESHAAPVVTGGVMKVLIAGGGTGGHVFPGIAVAEELRRMRPGAEVVFVGGRRGLEAVAVPEAGFRIRFILTRGFPRRAWWRWPWALLANVLGFFQALWVVMSERPNVVLGTGGYVSGPIALAAWMLGRPLIL